MINLSAIGGSDVHVCHRCLMPSTRPRIVFDESGVCNGCLNADAKDDINWAARKAEFEQLVEENRPAKGHYDCIVPWSGGKDSSAIAWRLKHDYGLNPLLVTFSPMIPTEVGVHNREALLRAGFDHLLIRPNQRVARHLAQRFFRERGNPKVAWDAGVTATPMQVAVRYEIPLIFYAEHGESEYGGRVLSEVHRKMRDMAEFLEHQVGDDPMNWVDDVAEEHDLAPMLYPDMEDVERVGVKALYFGYFHRWDVYKNYELIRDAIDFRTAPGGRTDGTFTNYDSLDDKIDNLYYYMQFIKFGFGRTTRDASRMIQLGHITREQGLEYVRQYDDEFPHTDLADVLEYLDLDQAGLEELVDMHRNSEIWEMTGNGWRPKFEIA